MPGWREGRGGWKNDNVAKSTCPGAELCCTLAPQVTGSVPQFLTFMAGTGLQALSEGQDR